MTTDHPTQPQGAGRVDSSIRAFPTRPEIPGARACLPHALIPGFPSTWLTALAHHRLMGPYQSVAGTQRLQAPGGQRLGQNHSKPVSGWKPLLTADMSLVVRPALSACPPALCAGSPERPTDHQAAGILGLRLEHLLPALHARLLLDVLPPVTHVTQVPFLGVGPAKASGPRSPPGSWRPPSASVPPL